MDLQSNLISKQEVEYLLSQMKNLYATQAEHSDRLVRLESRQDGETRLKSVWGGQSPFTTPLNGTPQHGPSYNPGEAFKNFDQDHSGSMMGSLHLDAEEEPRRGASRANSVRFDESAIHGHFGPSSRAQSELFPPRSGSALSSHPLTDRSSSHKSEGRASSTQSTRGSSIGIESRPLSATVPAFAPSSMAVGPPPGLFIIGPVPAIIRCWLDTNFSNESLLYAAVCTGSYKSIINHRLVQKLGYEDRVSSNHDGQSVIKLPVHLPEGTVQQASVSSSSAGSQLPTLTTDFIVQETHSSESIDIFLGSDVLRLRNADIHFSVDRLTLFDDERNKVSVPLVRPENTALFQRLQTTVEGTTRAGKEHQPDPPLEVQESSLPQASPSSSAEASPALHDEEATNVPHDDEIQAASSEADAADDKAAPDESTTTGGSWPSWRRDTTPRGADGYSTVVSTSGYQKPGRGRSMKVLKPARLNTNRAWSSTNTSATVSTPTSGTEAATSSRPAEIPRSSSGFGGSSWRASNANANADANSIGGSNSVGVAGEASPADEARRSTSGERERGHRPGNVSSGGNPIGGGSAFGWLNSGR